MNTISAPAQRIGDLWRIAAKRLDAAGVDAPANTARLLLAHALGKPKAWVTAHADEALSAEQTPALQQYEQLLARLITREPLFYVIGEREFYGLPMRVTPDVLIPRPETEMLVDLAMAALRDAPALPCPAMVDVGTGSGAVAIAVAHHMSDASVLATDISLAALEVAKENAVRHQVSERVWFAQMHLLSALATLPPIITANLPYVAQAEIDALPPEIQHFEPRIALDGGADGLELVRQLLHQIARYQQRAGARSQWRYAFLEIGAAQGADALRAARHILPNATSRILKDLAGLDRVLYVEATT